MSLLAARTRDGPLAVGGEWKFQQFGQCSGTCLMHRRTHRHLDGLQIELLCLAVGGEDDAQQLIYFAGDFLLDRFRRFFSWANGWGSSRGRNRQTPSFTSNSCSLSCRKR